MTEKRRIFLNVAATYARSLYSLAIGLFASRWVLGALGAVDFGLYGVIGGLVTFIAFINGLLSMAVGRFYAVEIGAAKVCADKVAALENCRKWFNTALLIHIAVPLALIIIGYPIGDWAVRNFLTIPVDRVDTCVWVWRFTCLSCFVGMANVPFQSMYTAKQEIAELTIYSFATTTCNAFFFYYMFSHPGAWLGRYAAWMCLVSVVPALIICARAIFKYPECRFNLSYCFDCGRIKSVCNYAMARFITAVSGIVFTQGQAILANKFFGAVFNASMAIGNSVSGHTSTLSGALSGAFWPAIANAAGAKDIEKVKRFSFATCRLGSVLVLIFAVPIILEINEVLLLWLKTPPLFAAELCVAVVIGAVIERSAEGYWMAVFSMGQRVSYYSGMVGISGFIGFLLTLVFLLGGMGGWGVIVALLATRIITLGLRLWLGYKLISFSPRDWLNGVGIPLAVLSVIAFAIGFLPHFMMPPSFMRICLTTVFSEVALLPVLWFFVFTGDERSFVASRIQRVLRKRS